MRDFNGALAIGLSGAPEVAAAVEAVAEPAEREFYARLLGVAEAGRFFEDLREGKEEAAAFADLTRGDATRYAYCRITEESRDGLQALAGVFASHSATGDRVEACRRLSATWNAMCVSLDLLRPRIEDYRRTLRQDMGLPPARAPRFPFLVTNSMMI